MIQSTFGKSGMNFLIAYSPFYCSLIYFYDLLFFLGELRGPQVHGDDSLLGDPASVDIDQLLLSSQTLGGLEASDKNTVGAGQILDGGTLSQKLGVGKNVEADVLVGVGLKDGAHALGSTAWNS